MPSSIFSDRRVVFAVATLCCLLWGSAVPAVKFGYGLIGIAPTDTGSLLLFAGVRFSLAGSMLLGYGLATGRAVAMARGRFGEVALLGLGQTAVQYVCYYVGLAHTSAVKTSILSSTLVFFSVILAHFIYANDRLDARRAVGCLIGFAGVVVVNAAASGALDFHFSALGEGLLLVSTFAGSLAAIYGRRLSQTMDATVMTGWQLLVGGLVLTGMGLAGGGHFAFGVGAGALLVYLSALSAIAFALWSLLLKHNPVGSVAIYNFEIPIFGAILAALVLGESILEWKNLAALVLVSVGIWLVTARGRTIDVGRPAAPE